jgi:hypothetical protein
MLSTRTYDTRSMVQTQRGAVYWLLFWTAMTASTLWMHLPHDPLTVMRMGFVLVVPYAFVGRVLFKLRQFERDGREPGEVEGFVFETACMFPVLWGAGVGLLVRVLGP